MSEMKLSGPHDKQDRGGFLKWEVRLRGGHVGVLSIDFKVGEAIVIKQKQGEVMRQKHSCSITTIIVQQNRSVSQGGKKFKGEICIQRIDLRQSYLICLGYDFLFNKGVSINSK